MTNKQRDPNAKQTFWDDPDITRIGGLLRRFKMVIFWLLCERDCRPAHEGKCPNSRLPACPIPALPSSNTATFSLFSYTKQQKKPIGSLF